MHAHAPPVANNTVIEPPKAPSIETVRSKRDYIKPDYTQLLAPGAKGDYDRKALIERSRVIAETLESFGAPGKVVEINTGPVITRTERGAAHGFKSRFDAAKFSLFTANHERKRARVRRQHLDDHRIVGLIRVQRLDDPIAPMPVAAQCSSARRRLAHRPAVLRSG